MNSPKNPQSKPLSEGSAEELVSRWSQSQPELEEERLQRLRGLSERDAALQFARLLYIRGPWPLRPTSGLVDQQRILARLRKKS